MNDLIPMHIWAALIGLRELFLKGWGVERKVRGTQEEFDGGRR